MTNLQYFQSQLETALQSKSTEKANYYGRRITELAKSGKGNQSMKNTKCLDSAPEMLQKAIKVWNVRAHDVSTKHAFLAGKGIPEYIIFAALPYVGHGKAIADL